MVPLIYSLVIVPMIYLIFCFLHGFGLFLVFLEPGILSGGEKKIGNHE
jgi:hypothetical protein